MPEKVIVGSCAEMEDILRKGTLGFLGLDHEGQPYVVPLTYAYVKGKILFHCALEGKKIDCIRANPQVCFTVGNLYGEVCRHPQGAQCREDHDSVICYGRARIIEDMAERREVMNVFNRCLLPDAEEIPLEAVSNCYAVEIAITNMTGRAQREGTKRSYWAHSFHDRSRGEA